MGLFDFLKKKIEDNSPAAVSSIEVYRPALKAELIDHDKQTLLVQQVQLCDMEQFTSLPFVWNCKIKKVVGPSAKPYAYMDIIGENVEIAENELEDMNVELLGLHHLSAFIPRSMQIPTWDILFAPQEKTGYSKIICNPYTFSGRKSKYPASLFFLTKHTPSVDSTHGELFYLENGNVGKARICFWRNKEGYFVHFRTVNRKLIVSKVETTLVVDNCGLPGVIYKAP